MRRCRRASTALALLAAVAAALLAAGTAEAHFQVAPYTYGSCPAATDGAKDPINLVFWNYAFGTTVTNHVQFHTGWTNDSGSTQNFASHGWCAQMFSQRASAGATSSRYHVRISPLLDSDPTWGWTVAASAHHEDFIVYCGHAVDKTVNGWSGFDMGRRAVYDALIGTHKYSYENWGNTRQFKQCDGDWAGSNGIVGWWYVPVQTH